MEFTNEQLEAIKAGDANIIVSAAAGSGKTAVLVERVVRLMEEGADVDQMLIMTFTKAASADMRRKLSERLYAWAESGHEEEAARQLEKLEYAQICTIDSFCSDLVRTWFELADCDPGFRIIDAAQSERMRQEALDEALEEAYKGGIGTLGEGRSPEEIKGMALRLSDFLDRCVSPEKWFENAMELAASNGEKWKGAAETLPLIKLNQAKRLLSRANRTAMKFGGPDAYCDIIEEEIRRLSAMEEKGLNAESAAADVFFPKLPPVKGADEELKKACQKLRQAAKKAVDEMRSELQYDYDRSLEDVRADSAAFAKLYEITVSMQEKLWKAKKEISGMTFSDLERRALKVLCDDGAAKTVSEKYKYIFVDEYQDTSDIQEELVSRIKGDRNLFMVGDVKQSIYRFRGAVPAIFQKKCEEYKHSEGNKRLVLSRNFRSSESVLACVNRIFERVMNGGASEIVYDGDARLNYGGSFKGKNVPSEILIAHKGAGEDEKTELSNTELEGRMIAKRIHELMQEDPSLKLRDICVLARAGSHFPELAEILSSNGIRAYTEKGENFYDEVEIKLVMSVLRLVVSSRNDLDVIAVLRSPIIGMSTQEMAEMRAENPFDTLWNAALKGREKHPGCDRMIKLIDELRLYAYGTSINRVIRRLLQKTGLYAFVGALEGGVRRQGNLDILCRNACRFETDIGGSLADFVDYAANLAKNKDSTGAHELGEGDDVVRIMTDHKSKGLQFRVVFAMGMDREFASGGQRDSNDLMLDSELGWALTHTDVKLGTCRETLAHRAMKASERDREIAEELRILYVTLTRAEERLIMTGVVGDLEDKKDEWLLSSEIKAMQAGDYSSALDIVCSAAAGCAGAELLGKKAENGAPEVTVRVFEPEELTVSETADAGDERDISAYPDDEWLRESINWVYPEQEKPFAPVKLAVTGLEREFTGGLEVPDIHTAPEFMNGDVKLNPAGRGTAVHQALRNMDYSRLRGADDMTLAIEEQLLEMADDGRLLPEESDMITVSELARFFESELGSRVLRAETVKREWSFCLRMPTERVIKEYPAGNEIFVQGTVDLCFIEDGEWVLVDYKTNHVPDDKKLVERYSSQLDIYAEALETLTGIKVKEAMLCLISLNRVIPVKTKLWEKKK